MGYNGEGARMREKIPLMQQQVPLAVPINATAEGCSDPAGSGAGLAGGGRAASSIHNEI